ncbi:hypothetical protein [Mucilaginibacter sp. OK283]|jgi:hypothetical protein|uniref:hypothetical protein n=1 Tax=Mucilaginibacter sp. OK283 TaxID=1881049 RepID=UPI0008CA9996|nr:hypothetical protein [Mucilaginibacter sp. OK283]SEO44675.1 hypothetical protein SAMN05428947_102395 [Mucilaginibacter sp. OK283]
MNLYRWSGFPASKDIQGIAVANSVEEARALIVGSFSKNEQYNSIREHLYNNEPTVYTSPAGWLQDVGAQ